MYIRPFNYYFHRTYIQYCINENIINYILLLTYQRGRNHYFYNIVFRNQNVRKLYGLWIIESDSYFTVI